MAIDGTSMIAPILGFLVSFIVSVVIVRTKHLHGRFKLDTGDGVQKFHKSPTPRVGGISLALGYFVVWLSMEGETRDLFGLVGLAGIAPLAFGMAEDLTQRVGARLLATITSGLGFAMLTGYTIDSVDVYGVDAVLRIPLFAFAFTAFAIGGAANSINIIDGFHGLASGTLIIIFLSFALAGWRVGDAVFVQLALLMAAIVGGFFVVNFPYGKLFLGDSGAYFTGYLMAILAVMLPARNSEVSPWVSLLILGYPVTETIVSMVRRSRGTASHPGEPDDAHLHHIVHRNWARGAAVMFNVPSLDSPMTSVIMWIFPVTTLLSVWFLELNTLSSVLFLALIVACYVMAYRGLLAREKLEP
ncbi:MAG: glycosyltransferase [Paracoccaceae bacterium]